MKFFSNLNNLTQQEIIHIHTRSLSTWLRCTKLGLTFHLIQNQKDAKALSIDKFSFNFLFKIYIYIRFFFFFSIFSFFHRILLAIILI